MVWAFPPSSVSMLSFITMKIASFNELHKPKADAFNLSAWQVIKIEFKSC